MKNLDATKTARNIIRAFSATPEYTNKYKNGRTVKTFRKINLTKLNSMLASKLPGASARTVESDGYFAIGGTIITLPFEIFPE